MKNASKLKLKYAQTEVQMLMVVPIQADFKNILFIVVFELLLFNNTFLQFTLCSIFYI